MMKTIEYITIKMSALQATGALWDMKQIQSQEWEMVFLFPS